jgi:uncharacterized membrane protein YidH (DUF202 family)
MFATTFARLVRRRILTSVEFEDIIRVSAGSGKALEKLLTERGVPKHELLYCLTETYDCPFVEFDESVIVSQQILRRIDAERLKRSLWFPLSVQGDAARVIAWDPRDPVVVDDVKKTLGVMKIDFLAALPSDLIRIIEHNQDLNPHFPPAAGRTPLAKVRTFLADRRSLYACIRTSLARGRTGLAFLRTGISFIAVALVLYRIFGIGLLTVLEVFLAAAGAVMAVDGLRWYLPARRAAGQRLACEGTEATNGTTVLQAEWTGDAPSFTRSGAAEDAGELRAGWNNLSPVMRRRFLASDRTDLAEERTVLACLRTKMARARTGLAFTRTGIAFVGLGIALLRIKQFQTGLWPFFDIALILVGAAMMLEGFYWYVPDRHAGAEGYESVRSADAKTSLWEAFFPPVHMRPASEQGPSCLPPVAWTHSPGIWATTGLALERTVLAERRNVMARLRTIMARSRTGLAFVRTGMSISAVGMGLLVYFGVSNAAWTALNAFFILAGLLLIADGLFWHIPAERWRRQLPYCFCDVEIMAPDYGRPARIWGKAVFSHDDL